jgi:HPt (histidine-containing phosphotransfer) domain-containing protein
VTGDRRANAEAAMEKLRHHFLGNVESTTAGLERLAQRLDAEEDATDCLAMLGKELHRLRGTAGTFGFSAASALAGEMEDEVEQWKGSAQGLKAGQRSARVRRFIREFSAACGVK